MYSFVKGIDRDFVQVCGFKSKPFRKKVIISEIWNDLDNLKSDFSALKKYLKKFKVDLTQERCDFGIDQIPISGYYCPDTNRMEMIFGTENYDNFRFTTDKWNQFKFSLIQVLCHEIVHMMQFSNRDYNWSYRRCKYRKVKNQEVNQDRGYHSSLDEIQAYAHCVFLELLLFNVEVSKHMDRRAFKHSSTYNMILSVFGNRSNEPTIEKLMYHVVRWNRLYKSQ